MTGDLIEVPSGQDVRFIEAVIDKAGPAGATARFRFLAPAIGTGVDADTAAGDMQMLCDSYALPKTDGMVPEPQQIVISLSAVELPFGESAPDVPQFFEAYSIADGHCIWEVF
ncbi:MAG: acetolactate synthase [Tabrizicola sp.]|nr:acetolactate synthase [Tabrizicola sp.]